ncbi:MAG: 1,4-alpha-glucan branching enzyme [Pelotomaculum sp. PtaB.Bin104]|nr:MAG: 1,4-alpha-glucan branching enzyme [Pelotomaculum sp. PtaB.Bin104]
MSKGYLALVLHAHLPYVCHPERENALEERWLCEAITDTYIPLLKVFQGLIQDGADFHLTMSITPTLLSMLSDELLQKRYLKHINSLIKLAECEAERTKALPEFNQLAEGYLHRFNETRLFYLSHHCDLIRVFRELQDSGHLEIITSAATHAFLPFIRTEEAVRAQVKTAIRLHEKHFRRQPRGIWLPECAYRPGLDQILRECGLQFFFTEAHGVGCARPAPVFGLLSPVLTTSGVAAFPRDVDSSHEVWDARTGFPSDYDYREYYRDIGFDLPREIIGPFIHPDSIRLNTGIKYYRITGYGEHKEPYNPDWAFEKAARHAGHFLAGRQKQVEHWQERMGRQPLVCAPYDAELFGHWWYEGPLWLDLLLRKIHFDQDDIKTITPSEYLKLYADYQVCDLAMSTWGRHGYADVWLREENDWIYPALHQAEQVMIRLANRFTKSMHPENRLLNQMARELMLAQSSDWAFIMDNHTMVDYAVKRTKYHINRFNRLQRMIEQGEIDGEWLSTVEKLDNIFPEIDYRDYRSSYQVPRYLPMKKCPRVLMLSWEFPPLVIGGISRHVYDLSRYLARIGWEVHVVTSETGDTPHTELVEGVHVHRVHVLQPDGDEFLHWVFQLNLMMIDCVQLLADSGLEFELIHAHDWLVGDAARALKQRYGWPLVGTIHATEHGRNQGIYTAIQRNIHSQEWRLTYEAKRVIVCSTYMQREVIDIFQLPADKIDIIPNGVDVESLHLQAAGPGRRSQEPYAADHEQIILYFGRLVREKGVQTLIQAMPLILGECPDAKLVIIGQGPALPELESLTADLDLGHKILFTGYLSDEERNHLLGLAAVAVFPSLYEPFGIVALEAMAAGIPVVVSDVGGLGDIVRHGHNGLKMYPGDVTSLGSQVLEIIKNKDFARALADTATKEIGRFDWCHIAGQTIEVYLKAMDAGLKLSDLNREMAATGE